MRIKSLPAAYPLPNVVDTTGCGDSYHGAFLFGLLRGMKLEQLASLASAVAALNSPHLGGQTGLPTWEQVKSFLSRASDTQRLFERGAR
jgi:sulfofructose kinase